MKIATLVTLLAGLFAQVTLAQQQPQTPHESLPVQMTVPELAQAILLAPAEKFEVVTEGSLSGFYDRDVRFTVDDIVYTVRVLKKAVNGGKTVSFYWQVKGSVAIGRCIDHDGDRKVDFCRLLSGQIFEQVVEGDGVKSINHIEYHEKHGLSPLTRTAAQLIFETHLQNIQTFIRKANAKTD